MKYQTYTKYKPSRIEYPEAIPDGWQIRRLKSLIFSIDNGQWGEDELGDGTDWIVLRVADFGEKEFNLKKELTLRAITNKKLRLHNGDLVIEKSGGGEKQLVGRVVQLVNAVNSKKYTYSNFVGKLIIGNEVDNRFLLYFFKSFYNSKKNYKHIKQTTGIQNLDADSLLQTEYIALPAITDQKKISDFLDKKTKQIDDLIKKDKQLIELLNEKRIALINKAVTKGLDDKAKLVDSGVDWIGEIPEGWGVRRLKEVSDVLISNVDKKSKPGEPEVFLCNYVDVYKNEYIDSKLNFMKATATIEQFKKLIVECGDVIITKDSETPEDIAVPAYVRSVIEKLVCGYHLALLKTNKNKILGEYLFRLFQSKKINSYFEIEANGVTRFGVSTYPIKNLSVCLPPIFEQTSIVKFIDKKTEQIDEHIKKILHRIKLLGEYKKSLIYNAVTGKIKV